MRLLYEATVLSKNLTYLFQKAVVLDNVLIICDCNSFELS